MCSQILFLSTVALVLSLVSARATSGTKIVRCVKATDCLDERGRGPDNNQCCVYDPSIGDGVCKKMLVTSQECNTKQPYAWVRPVEMVTDYNRCPCDPGLFCAEWKSKEIGICTYA